MSCVVDCSIAERVVLPMSPTSGPFEDEDEEDDEEARKRIYDKVDEDESPYE